MTCRPNASDQSLQHVFSESRARVAACRRFERGAPFPKPDQRTREAHVNLFRTPIPRRMSDTALLRPRPVEGALRAIAWTALDAIFFGAIR